MVNTKTNRILCIISLCLLLPSAIAAITPTISGHEPAWQIPTYAYVTASPNTIGIGDYTVIVMWLDKFPPTAGGLGGDRWRGFALDITKPDGTQEHLGPIEPTSQVGSTWTTYTPTQAGTYTIVFSWPGQTLTNGTGTPVRNGIAYVGDFFMPATSEPITLQVTQSPVEGWQEPSVPTGYWTRPINDANRGWSQLASNWLKGSWLVDNFQTAGKAPNTPHVLWTREIVMGGIPDAQWPGNVFQTDDYQSPWSSPIIMGGRIFINDQNMGLKYGYYCLDLLTGEKIWYKNGTDNGLNNPSVTFGYGGGASNPNPGLVYPQLSFGQLYRYYSVNGQGTLPYLWMTINSDSSGSWYMIDADTGNWILTLKHVPGGTSAVDQDGSLLRYSYNRNTGNILCWNSSQSIFPANPQGSGQQQWKPMIGATIDAVNDTIWTDMGPASYSQFEITEDDIRPRSGYTMNVTGPKGLPGLSAVLKDENRVPRILLFSDFTNLPSFGSSDMEFRVAAVQIDYGVAPYSPQPDKTFTQNNNLGYGVTLLWDKTMTKPLGGNLTFSLGSTSYVDGVWTIESKETMQRWGYDLNTGDQIWGPTEPEAAFNMYGMTGNVAYGKIFSTGYAGILYCYDIKNGNLLWNYSAPGIGYESPYGDYPLSIGAIADGKIYLYSSEHSPTIPLWRGSYLRCIDINNGHEVWKLLDFNMGMSLADGYIVTGNKYDNRMYVIGKGPSATTVSASPKVSPAGGSILIEGTVTDQSPGAKGTPAIADGDQQAWMEYLYEQQAMPANARGVSVHLTAIDPNGNLQEIGTVQSDSAGMFKKGWTPPIAGEYTIKANFEGTESYGTSSAETALLVGPAASAAISPSPTAIVQPPTSGMPTTTFIAIAAVIVIIVVAAAVLVLRKRK